MNGIFSIALDASVRAILAACCVAAILAAVRVRSATARHAAWTAVMAAMLLMPVVPRLALPISLPATTEAISQPAAPLPRVLRFNAGGAYSSDFTVARRCGPAVSTAARASAGTALLALALDDSRFLPEIGR